MTSLLEKIVAIIAPHNCITCGIENNIICEPCSLQLLAMQQTCAGCGMVSPDAATCTDCRATLPIEHIWVGGEYEGALEMAIHKLKFERAQAAAAPLAGALAQELPRLNPGTVIVPLPTAPRRIRQRGYDQTVKLAQSLAHELLLPVRPLLSRAHDLRQLGASRSKRFEQAAKAFYVPHPVLCQGAKVVLIDDVMTTGASLGAAAKLLAAAGARSIDAVVLAKQAARREVI